MKLLFVFFSVLPLSLSECPSLESIDVLYDDQTFLCTVDYQGPGDADAIQACNDCESEGGYDFPIPDGYENSVDTDDAIFPVGSLQVLAGCTYYGFTEQNYAGGVYEYPGPATYPLITTDKQSTVCGVTTYGFQSDKCRCTQKMIACDPVDEYTPILTCDGTTATTDFTCTYSMTVGTKYGTSAQESLNVSTDVEYEVQAGLLDLYSVDLQISSYTGYDWTTSTMETFEYEHGVRIEVPVEAGKKASIEQIIGRCSDNTSQSTEYRVVDATADGRVTGIRHFSAAREGGEMEEKERRERREERKMRRNNARRIQVPAE